VSRQSQDILARQLIANIEGWWAGTPQRVVSLSVPTQRRVL